MEEAIEEVEKKEYDQLESIDLCVLSSDLDELTDNEELDEHTIDDPNYIPKEISGTIETSIISHDEPGEEKAAEQGLAKEYAAFGKPQWSKTDLPSCTTETGILFDEEMKKIKEDLRDLSPRKIFEKFLSDEIISYICEQSIIYARQKNNHSFTIEPQEMQTFLQFYI